MDKVRSYAHLKHVGFLNNEPTPNKQPSPCCKSSYRIRKLKNKGAILILLWSLLVTGTINFSYTQDRGTLFNIQLVTIGLTLPIAGWLADIYFGRYKVIHWSMWTMWIAFVLATASSVVEQLVESYSIFSRYVNGVLMVVAFISLGGFLANIIQFGMDQLQDASTSEITSFISWYIWCICSSQCIIESVQRGFDCIQYRPQLFGMLVVCVQLSIALSLTFLLNHWLIQEPVTQNPFKLVFKVLKYAIKYKQPRLRSAFTYCEDELPSRIDFCKNKYGGPFTTEQVEDVKTFLRMLTVCFAGSTSVGVIIPVFMLKHQVHVSTQLNTGHGGFTVFELFECSWVVLIPLHEFVLYPMFYKYLAAINSQTKFVLGVLLQIATIIVLMLIEIVVRHNYLEENTSYQNTTTIQCNFYHKSDGVWSLSLDYRWMAIPDFLYSLSITLLGIGASEFITAQSPYSMRGLIVGCGYGMLCLTAVLTVAISIPFTKRLSIQGSGVTSCEFWYTLLLLIIEILACIMLVVTLKFYKKRKREDVLPNEHIFAERYYAKDH